MRGKKPEWTFEPPKMSWDEPIEEEILAFVRVMKTSWRTQRHSIWPSVRKAAQAYVNAYEVVEKHILKEIRIRKEIAEQRSHENPS